MTFPTSIQALIGTNTCSQASNLICGVNWASDKVFIRGAPPTYSDITLARLSLLDGTEEDFGLLADYDVTPTARAVGVDGNGHVYLSAGGLYAGAITKINGSTLAQMANGPYSTTYFGGAAMANVIVGATQYILDTNSNGGISGQLMVSHDTTQDFHQAWPIPSGKGFVCPGQSESDVGYFVHTPSNGGAQVTLYEVDCAGMPSPTLTSLGAVVPSDVDAGWTTIGCNGICLDETDGNLLAIVYGQSAATQRSYAVKLDVSDASVIWSTAIPAAGTSQIAGGGQMMAQSRILSQKFTLLIARHISDPLTVLEINTSTGAALSYTSGLAGVVLVSQSPQAFNDASGGIVCNLSYDEDSGSPARLNLTPASFDGWSVLYVSPTPPTPTPATDDGWFNVSKPIQIAA